ncbi:DUF262 domain-containing protein [Marinilabilia salmonicolor]|uniref:Uncharacterized protein DUF262 n=1 Tax=Marinilabilia salmonicolor TaxID=989 RepID=A0A368UY48_9BACT|nr:DUF262 domain-containing protein [Marinilabilia salmonicolor]RCW33867.1 uncharacterized protein DUF262 [Marinilabilia salmonicolor]
MKTSFWKLINRYKIEIPEIQRDYAQGRIDEKVNAIRKKFIEDLLACLFEDDKFLNLDFIFGQSISRQNIAEFEKHKYNLESMLNVLAKYSEETGISFEHQINPKPIDKNKEKVLIPIDGQQRLTTLFLLHLFFGARASKDTSLLNNFTYCTRKSSTQFIEKLIANKKILNQKTNKPSTNIKDEPWFFKSWTKDPTIQGMLVTLDEIARQTFYYEDNNFPEGWKNLITEDYKIFFNFFDIQEKNLNNDLYIKMNARGKPLSEFENFKAWLEKKWNNSSITPDDWKIKLDKEWMNLFWDTKDKISDIDTNYLNFFKIIALFRWIDKNNNIISSDAINEQNLAIIKKLRNNNYVPIEFYENNELFNDQDTIHFIFYILDCMSNEEHLMPEEEKFETIVNSIWHSPFYNESKGFRKTIFNSILDLNLTHLAFIYSVFRFLYLSNHQRLSDYSDLEKKNLTDWLRVSRNIIYNSRIDNEVPFVKAVNAIAELENNILNIKGHIKFTKDKNNQNRYDWISFFSTRQVNEEWIKSNLDPNFWEDSLIKAEDHIYFYGQIQFLLNLSVNAEDSELYNLEKFQYYLSKASQLFSKENLENNTLPIQRAFFAFDKSEELHWMRWHSNWRACFYSNNTPNSRIRDENWRNLFNKKTGILKDFLDSRSDFSFTYLMSYINDEKEKTNNWRFFILDNPDVLQHCGHNMIRFLGGNKEYTRLLEKTTAYSNQRDLKSYHLYLKFKYEEVLDISKERIKYCSVSHQGEVPFGIINGWYFNNQSYEIRFYFDVPNETFNKPYQVRFFHPDANNFNNYPNIIKKTLQEDFQFFNETDDYWYGLWKVEDTYEEAKNLIIDLCKALNKL